MEQTFCLLILEVMERGTRAEREIQKLQKVILQQVIFGKKCFQKTAFWIFYNLL